MELEQLKFPIGRCDVQKKPTKEQVDEWIRTIEDFPNKIKSLTQNLSIEQLNWKYRPEGWTIKQVVHHCADSHMNSLIRFKLALTENTPVIKPYREERWAELVDGLGNDLEDSLSIIQGVHSKWAKLLRSLSPEKLQLEFIHPDGNQKINLAENIGIYAWHGEHHLAHIENAIQIEGKFEG